MSQALTSRSAASFASATGESDGSHPRTTLMLQLGTNPATMPLHQRDRRMARVREPFRPGRHAHSSAALYAGNVVSRWSSTGPPTVKW